MEYQEQFSEAQKNIISYYQEVSKSAIGEDSSICRGFYFQIIQILNENAHWPKLIETKTSEVVNCSIMSETNNLLFQIFNQIISNHCLDIDTSVSLSNGLIWGITSILAVSNLYDSFINSSSLFQIKLMCIEAKKDQSDDNLQVTDFILFFTVICSVIPLQSILAKISHLNLVSHYLEYFACNSRKNLADWISATVGPANIFIKGGKSVTSNFKIESTRLDAKKYHLIKNKVRKFKKVETFNIKQKFYL